MWLLCIISARSIYLSVHFPVFHQHVICIVFSSPLLFCSVLTLPFPIGCSLRVVSFSCPSKADPAHPILRSILFVSIPSIHHYARAPHSTFYRLFPFSLPHRRCSIQFNSSQYFLSLFKFEIAKFSFEGLVFGREIEFPRPNKYAMGLRDGEPCIFIIPIIIITVCQYHPILYLFFDILYDP